MTKLEKRKAVLLERIGAVEDERILQALERTLEGTTHHTLTPEQLKNAQSIMGKQAGRRKGMKYNKKYPKSKQDLFNGIVEYLQGQGAEIMPAERQNFRDLDFTLNGVHYKIVLSNPRK